MRNVDRILTVNKTFANSVIAGLGEAVGYDVNIFFPLTQSEAEESAYQQDANQDSWPEEPDLSGNFPIVGLTIKRFNSDETLEPYPDDRQPTLYLPTDLDVPNQVKIIVMRGNRYFAFSGDVVDVVEAEDEPMFKHIRLEPMETP